MTAMGPVYYSFRAFDKRKRHTRRVEQVAMVVERWLDSQQYSLTEGPAEPFSCPQNVMSLSEAAPLLRQPLEAHLPLHLWRYPLEFQLQLWIGGWDVKVDREALQVRRYAGKFETEYRQQLLNETLLDLTRALRPLVLVGPAKRPPADLEPALHAYRRWDLFYIGGIIAKAFHWPEILDNAEKKWQVCLPTGGIWASQLNSSFG
jgi:hypothetical protein